MVYVFSKKTLLLLKDEKVVFSENIFLFFILEKIIKYYFGQSTLNGPHFVVLEITKREVI
ncbi:hypothetical protein [Borreliella kurtenbachii]|uniref:hypothetical protein n=1 Tax=Borreliella kurtenbachii TaxID=1196056 RepID=UPI003461A49A